MTLHSSILETIGRTPVVRLNNLGPQEVDLYVKLEAANPGGSVKDRLALGLIEAAEREGRLRPGQTVVEATSGNTGIGLAVVCAQKGYPLVVVMAENFSLERRKLLRFMGAQVVLTPASAKGSGMLAKARELADAHGWFLCRQFADEANPETHARTTAEEILEDFGGSGPDYWVSGFGTGGTLAGVARVLRARSPGTRIVACEPDNSALLSSGIRQEHDADGGPTTSHPRFRPHPMQGWSPDFLPLFVQQSLEGGLIDEVRKVSGAAALATARQLAEREGILAGPSGGATLAAALAVAEEAPKRSRILAMLPDTGERYLSSLLFADVPQDMTDEERAIAASTPGYRLNVPQVAPAAVPVAAHPDAAALAHVEAIVADSAQPVVMFALSWCEFCWSVRRLFAAAGIPFRSVDLDAAPYSEGEFGGAVRTALLSRTGSPTIPQVFVGGRHVGGATETFKSFEDGSLAAVLGTFGIAPDCRAVADTRSLLPNWLHPRA